MQALVPVVKNTESHDEIRETAIDQDIFAAEKELAEGGKAVEARKFFMEMEQIFFIRNP